MRTPLWIFLLLIALAALSACASSPPQSKTPVEVWRGSDDGLTIRFSEAVERALTESGAFALSAGRRPGSVIVKIEDAVDWQKIGGRTRATAQVNFENASSKTLGTCNVSCWDGELKVCAHQVLKEAMRFRRPNEIVY